MNNRKEIGGSDSPVILGVSPFKTKKELWAEKLGLVPQPEATPAMKRGEVLEDLVAELYSQKTGRKLRRKKSILVHPNFSWMVGHVDRTIDGKRQVVEIKCPGIRVFSQIKREGLPDYYLIQMQHYLNFPQFDAGAFVVFNSELWELIHFDIEPDKELQEVIVQHDLNFWEENILSQIPPEDGDPEIELPQMEGKMFKADAIPEIVEMVDNLRQARQFYEMAQQEKELAEQTIKTAMNEAECNILEANGCRIYWSWQKGRRNLDRVMLKKDYPEINLDQYMIPGKPSRPFRPFWLKERAVE